MSIEPARRPLIRTEILRATDVADLLHVPLSTIHEWARTGLIPSRKRGRHRLFLRTEIESWVVAIDEPTTGGRQSTAPRPPTTGK